MRCPGGSLTKTVHSSFRASPPPSLVCAACVHVHMSARAATLPSDIYHSNPIPLRSIPPLPASHGPAGAACSCTFVKVKSAEAGETERRERERGRERGRKRWMAGEVLLMCAGPLTLPDRDPDKAVASQSGHR